MQLLSHPTPPPGSEYRATKSPGSRWPLLRRLPRRGLLDGQPPDRLDRSPLLVKKVRRGLSRPRQKGTVLPRGNSSSLILDFARPSLTMDHLIMDPSGRALRFAPGSFHLSFCHLVIQLCRPPPTRDSSHALLGAQKLSIYPTVHRNSHPGVRRWCETRDIGVFKLLV